LQAGGGGGGAFKKKGLIVWKNKLKNLKIKK
jgi:hypothetical protein